MNARSILSASIVALALVIPATASASTTTLGSIVEPGGSPAPQNCASEVAVIGETAATYEVGASGGEVTSWSVNATGDDDGGTETLYVLAPNSAGSYTVVGLDTETIPSVIPAGGTLTFTLKDPIAAASGDTFGLSATSSGIVNCAWEGGDTPFADVVYEEAGQDPSVGQMIAPSQIGPGEFSVQQVLLDLSVTLVPSNNDLAVSTTAGPGNAIVNNEALLSSTVTDNGPNPGPATFTDAVPAGLAIDAVAAAGATCTVAGQAVTCNFASLAVGASAPVEIVVTPVAAQSYQNTVSVADADGATDPNPANNSATATLVAAATPAATPAAAPPVTPAAAVSTARACVATNLKGLSEKVVKRLLPALGCKVGKVKNATSKSVAKGDVISLTPGSGSHAAGTQVALTVSSGKPKSKHKG